ncbi:MAG: hypothetical protein AAGI37_19830 [Planctomycetota bacterium]
MNILFFLFPFVIAYAVFRGVKHLRAGREMWAYQFFIVAGFVALFFLYEVWLKSGSGQG